MRIALVSSVAPFILGGSRNIVEWLAPHLEAAGHQVEIIYLPFSDDPDLLFPQLAAYRSIDLTDDADLVVCFRPPAHIIKHPRKVLWFIHHLRAYYDLWDTEYRFFPDTAIHRSRRDALRDIDSRAIAESHRVFTNSQIVGDRIQRFNAQGSRVLYPPVDRPERFFSAGDSDTIVYLARLEHHKRQHLLVEALQYTRHPVRLLLAGAGSGPDYAAHLRERAIVLGVDDRLDLEDRWISEDDKVEILSTALAVAYIPLDEDSYGYPSLEASHASKALLTTTDSGGVLELVTDGHNGYIVEPTPEALAEAMDRLFEDRETTTAMGTAANARIDELNIAWGHVVRSILS